jgi:hypothetical protein
MMIGAATYGERDVIGIRAWQALVVPAAGRQCEQR